MAVAREGTRLAALDDEFGPIAIVFDFVNPAVALGRIVHQRRQLKLDKRKPVPTSFGTHAHNSPHRTQFNILKLNRFRNH